MHLSNHSKQGWRLNIDYSPKRKRSTGYTFQTRLHLEKLVEQPRLLGGSFTKMDVTQIQMIADHSHSNKVYFEYKQPRHTDLSQMYVAMDVMKRIAPEKSLVQGLQMEINAELLKGQHKSGTIGRMNYNEKANDLELCAPENFNTAPARLRAHPTPPVVDIGRKVILQWPCNLVMPVKKGQSVWKRASKDFGHLTWKEQVESLAMNSKSPE